MWHFHWETNYSRSGYLCRGNWGAKALPCLHAMTLPPRRPRRDDAPGSTVACAPCGAIERSPMVDHNRPQTPRGSTFIGRLTAREAATCAGEWGPRRCRVFAVRKSTPSATLDAVQNLYFGSADSLTASYSVHFRTNCGQGPLAGGHEDTYRSSRAK